jgi:hypothetical protein
MTPGVLFAIFTRAAPLSKLIENTDVANATAKSVCLFIMIPKSFEKAVESSPHYLV